MIRINLMPRAEARRQAARQRDKQVFGLIAAVLAAIVIATELVTRREESRVEEEARTHEAELKELSRRHQDALLLDKKRAQLKAKLATIDVLDRQRRGPVHVLDDLSSATPEKLWLTEIKESGGGMTLIGKGLDNQTIAQFMRKLAGSPYFESVDLVETKQIEEGQAKLKQFTISARVNYAGRVAQETEPAADAGGGPLPGAASGSGGAAQAGAAEQAAAEQGATAPEAAAPAEVQGAPTAGSSAGPLGGAVAARDAAQRAAGQSESRDRAQDAAAAAVAGAPR